MNQETHKIIIDKANELIMEPSCYAGLKTVAQAYIDAVDKDTENAAFGALVSALEEDVQSIDSVIEFFGTDQAKEIFGADTAAALLQRGKEVKAAGGLTCFCDACQAGKSILDLKSAY